MDGKSESKRNDTKEKCLGRYDKIGGATGVDVNANMMWSIDVNDYLLYR